MPNNVMILPLTTNTRYDLTRHTNFYSSVEAARWNEPEQLWEVTVKDEKTKQTRMWRCRILVSGVGSLSIPRKCEIPGAESFKGPLFHSAQWDHSFDWTDKNVVVLGCVVQGQRPSLRFRTFANVLRCQEWL